MFLSLKVYLSGIGVTWEHTHACNAHIMQSRRIVSLFLFLLLHYWLRKTFAFSLSCDIVQRWVSVFEMFSESFAPRAPVFFPAHSEFYFSMSTDFKLYCLWIDCVKNPKKLLMPAITQKVRFHLI